MLSLTISHIRGGRRGCDLDIHGQIYESTRRVLHLILSIENFGITIKTVPSEKKKSRLKRLGNKVAKCCKGEEQLSKRLL
jgi:hypothetical protein